MRDAFARGMARCNSVHLAHAWATFEAEQRRYGEARRLYSVALELEPESAYVRHSWGVFERDVFGDTAAALDLFAAGEPSILLGVEVARTRHADDPRACMDCVRRDEPTFLAAKCTAQLARSACRGDTHPNVFGCADVTCGCRRPDKTP